MSRRLLPVTILLVTVFLIPMRRYEIPVQLPIHLEPYRPLVALIVVGWVLALLMMTLRLRSTSLDAPLTVLFVVSLVSIVANPERVGAHQAEVFKFLSLFLTFFVVYYIFASIVHTMHEIEYVVRIMVVLGTVVAAFAVVESRTGFTPFTHLERVFPILRPLPAELVFSREGKLRAYGTAEHPIALGALLAMMTPFAVYLAVATRRYVWWACTCVLALGALATISRTAVLMLLIILITITAIRWQDVRRHWIVIFPVLAVIHFAMPGTMGATKQIFFPAGGLIADQSTVASSRSSGGRLTDIAPSLAQFEEKPLLGGGLGTRITVGKNADARLLDNQWLGLLLDTGLAGVLAFLWLVLRFTRQQLVLARAVPGPAGYLPLACASSVLAYAFGMLTYDSFSFTQVTFAFFMILTIGASLQLSLREVLARERSAPSWVAGASPAPLQPRSLRPVS